MNQILITGDEPVVAKAAPKIKKEKTVLPIKPLIGFFAICIIVLGLCLTIGTLYAKDEINKTVEASIRPEISVERNDDDNTIEINVTHIRGITTVAYRWNDEEETVIEAKNRTSVSETINLIGGENTLNISVTEENGQIKTFQKTFIAGNIPEIEKLESVDNGVKIIAKSEEKLDYLQYSWDDGAMEKIEIGEKTYEGIISAPKGKHTLKIEIVDVNGMKAELEREVIGDTEPTVNVQSLMLDGKMTFVIDVEDDENITTMSIIHNGGEKQVIKVNARTHHMEVPMTEGEENTIIVTATNKHGLQKTRRIRFTNM